MRYLITGGSGYIGTRLVQRLAEREETERVVIADIRPPTAFRPKVTYERLDVRDAAAARELLAGEQPDALVHLAFVLNPMHDERTMYEIDVGGTHNVLEAASALTAYYPSAGPLLFAGACCVGLSRVYLGHHFPSDVAVGGALGSAIGLLSARLWRRWVG